jgi:hypothetical protein
MAVEVNSVGLFAGKLRKVVSKDDKVAVLEQVFKAPPSSDPRRPYVRVEGTRARSFPLTRVEREMIVYEADGPATA